MYSAIARQHASRPLNRAPLPDANALGTSKYPLCGDHFQLEIRTQDGLILEAKFQAKACGPVIAVGSVGTEMLRGKTTEQALKISAFELNDALGGLPPAKRHAILLFLDALHQAISSLDNNNSEVT